MCKTQQLYPSGRGGHRRTRWVVRECWLAIGTHRSLGHRNCDQPKRSGLLPAGRSNHGHPSAADPSLPSAPARSCVHGRVRKPSPLPWGEGNIGERAGRFVVVGWQTAAVGFRVFGSAPLLPVAMCFPPATPPSNTHRCRYHRPAHVFPNASASFPLSRGERARVRGKEPHLRRSIPGLPVIHLFS